MFKLPDPKQGLPPAGSPRQNASIDSRSVLPDWNAERARLKERLVAGEIGTATCEELERYLIVLVCSTTPDLSPQQHDFENEAFAEIIKKLLETRIMERQMQIADEHHAKNHHLNTRAYNLSYSAFWVSVGSAIAAISAAISAGIQAHYSSPAPPSLPSAPPAQLENGPRALASAPISPTTNSPVAAPPATANAVKIPH